MKLLIKFLSSIFKSKEVNKLEEICISARKMQEFNYEIAGNVIINQDGEYCVPMLNDKSEKIECTNRLLKHLYALHFYAAYVK